MAVRQTLWLVSSMTQESSPQTQHDWTVHSINIHGIFFERWCQQKVIEAPEWTLDSVNYPVEFPPANGPFRGKESALDIRASRMLDDIRLTLLIECKKCNPELVNWVFFEKPVQRSKPEFIASQAQIVPRSPPDERWDVVQEMRTLPSNFTISDEARETRAAYLDLKSSIRRKHPTLPFRMRRIRSAWPSKPFFSKTRRLSQRRRNSPSGAAKLTCP